MGRSIEPPCPSPRIPVCEPCVCVWLCVRYTLFGLELAEVLLEGEEMLSSVDALWSAYGNLSWAESLPATLTEPLFRNPSAEEDGTPPSVTSHVSEYCSHIFVEELADLSSESSAICPGFWPKVEKPELTPADPDLFCRQLWRKMFAAETAEMGSLGVGGGGRRSRRSARRRRRG